MMDFFVALAGVLGAGGFYCGLMKDDLGLMQATRVWPHAAMMYFIWKWSPAASAYHRWLLGGLGFCLAADFILRLPKCFLPGLVLFLIGHLFFIRAFISGEALWFWPRALPFFIYGAVLLAYLWPTLGAMRLPVAVYALVISMMGASAACRVGFGTSSWGTWLALGGAVLFIFSDSTLGIDRFHHALPQARTWIITTYWAALLGITLSSRT